MTGSGRRTLIQPKERPIDYASHTDALIYSWYTHLLSDLYERRLERLGIGNSVIAYRSVGGKSNLHFAKEVFDFLKDHPDYVAVALDVEKFFENVDHHELKKQWCNLLNQERLPDDHYAVFRAVTVYRYVSLEILRRIFGFRPHDHPKMRKVCSTKDFREKICDKGLLSRNANVGKTGLGAGIPQGSPISCVLSNLYMIDFDQAVAAAVRKAGGMYRRYSDDIIFVVPEEMAQTCENAAHEAIKVLYLSLNKDKTERRVLSVKGNYLVVEDWQTRVAAHLQYLGVVFDGKRTLLRHGGIARFQRRRNQAVRRLSRWADRNEKPIPKGVLLSKYTRKGKDNYLAYADRARDTLSSKAVTKQTAENRMGRQLKSELERSNGRSKI